MPPGRGEGIGADIVSGEGMGCCDADVKDEEEERYVLPCTIGVECGVANTSGEAG